MNFNLFKDLQSFTQSQNFSIYLDWKVNDETCHYSLVTIWVKQRIIMNVFQLAINTLLYFYQLSESHLSFHTCIRERNC